MRSAQASVVELEKGKRYRIFVELSADPFTGKRKRLTKVVRGSRKDAELAKVDLLIKANEVSSVTNITVAQYAQKVFLERKKNLVSAGKLKQRTIESYEERLRLHILPIIGDVPISSVKAAHVRKVQDAASTDAKKIEVRKVLSVLLKEAVYDELLPSNPVDAVRPPDRTNYEPDILDIEDIEVYLWHFRDTRAENILLLALGGAYRRGELSALNVEDINLETGEVTIDDAYTETKAYGTMHDSTKNGKARHNFLPASIIERLKETLPESGPVIASLDGQRLKPSSISQLFERTRDKLPEGVPRISLKNLRHTSLTLIYDKTGNLAAVAEHGGHASQSTSRRYYVRPHDDQKLIATQALDDVFGAQ